MYSKDLKEKIFSARQKGQSWNTISYNFGIPKTSCWKIVKNINAPRAPLRKPNLKVKGNIKKRLFLSLKELKDKNSRITSASVLQRSNVRLSISTVQRFMKNEGYKYLNTKKEIALTQKHKDDRREMCKKWLIAGIASRNIVFSDETRYKLDGPDNEMSWQQPGHRRKRPRRQAGGGGLMIWGMLFPSGELHYVEVQGTLNSVKYIKLLKDYALPIITSVFENDWLLQQDNAPCHSSTATMAFLEEKGVELLGWPSLSPDLNVIENVWQILANHIYKDGAARNVQDLREKIKEAVTAFNENNVVGHHVYSSFGRRVLGCYESLGNLVNA
jgi:hypothetical protein